MLIRPLESPDIPAVAGLLRELAREYIVHESPPEGASTFLAENDEMGVRGFLARGHVYHVAVVDGELAGFVAVRDRSHLFHLFVGKRWHRRGVARALWETARGGAGGRRRRRLHRELIELRGAGVRVLRFRAGRADPVRQGPVLQPHETGQSRRSVIPLRRRAAATGCSPILRAGARPPRR